MPSRAALAVHRAPLTQLQVRSIQQLTAGHRLAGDQGALARQVLEHAACAVEVERQVLTAHVRIGGDHIHFGVTCLSLLLAYKEAADVEVNHMRRALQRKRKPASSKPLPPEAVELADQYREAVTGRFPKGVLVKVQVRNEKGKAVLDFKGIPVEQVAKLVEALTGELPPVQQARLMEKVSPLA